jgi:hypothetical protein
MSERAQRPLSVWITQGLCLLNAIPTLLGASVPIARIVVIMVKNGIIPGATVDLLRFVLLVLVGGIAPLIAFWGMLRKKAYGKWLGVAMLLILVSKEFLTKDGQAPFKYLLSRDRSVYDSVFIRQASEEMLVVESLGYIFIHLLNIVLLYRLAFGKPARRFFSNQSPSPK